MKSWQNKAISPSPLIDSSLLDLLSAVSQFSDSFFDSYWVELTEKETEYLVVRLIQNLITDLQGQTLKVLLEEFRAAETDV